MYKMEIKVIKMFIIFHFVMCTWKCNFKLAPEDRHILKTKIVDNCMKIHRSNFQNFLAIALFGNHNLKF